MGTSSSKGASSKSHAKKKERAFSTRKIFGMIPDRYETLDEVTAALRRSGLESSNLIVAVDFTKSNEWTGKHTFGGRCLHEAVDGAMNPYETAITIIGRTLEEFDDDNLIPAFGFGDVSTHDRAVFSLTDGERPCRGFAEVLDRYRAVVPATKLAGGFRARPAPRAGALALTARAQAPPRSAPPSARPSTSWSATAATTSSSSSPTARSPARRTLGTAS